jgi:hypothetical protein
LCGPRIILGSVAAISLSFSRLEQHVQIDTSFSEITVHGGRMNEEQMKVVDQTQ